MGGGVQCGFPTFNISSAEQSRKVHSLESVASDGCILPDKYCDTVGLDTPIARAISVLDLPEFNISCLILRLIISSNALLIK